MGQVTNGMVRQAHESRIVISTLGTGYFTPATRKIGEYPALEESLALAIKKSSTYADTYAVTEGLFISEETGMAYVRRRTA